MQQDLNILDKIAPNSTFDRKALNLEIPFSKKAIAKAPNIKDESTPKSPAFLMNFIRRLSRSIHLPQHLSFKKEKGTKIYPIFQGKKPYIMNILNFFTLVRLVLRFLKILRSRTAYKTLDTVHDHQLEMINDVSYPKRNKPDKKMSFVHSRILRRSIRYVKRILRTKKFFFITIYSTFHFDKIIVYLIILDFFLMIFDFFGKRIPVIKPNTKMKVIWDTTIILTISIYFFIIPMQLSFDFFYDEEFVAALSKINISPSISHLIILVPELMLVVDTCLKLITGFYEDGIMVTEKSKIVHHYIKKGLILDLFAYVPVLSQSFFRQEFTNLFGNSISLKLLQLLLFCKFKRVHMALANFEEIISSNGQHDYVLSIFRLLYILLSIAHLNACLWHAVAYFNPDPSMSTWLTQNNLNAEYWDIKYSYSIYWAVSLMVTIGYGEGSPQNKFECLCGVVMLMISIFLFGYCINSMRKIWDGMAKQEDELKENIRVINGYMKRQNLNFELQGRVRKYLEYTINNENNGDQESEILNKLTKSLKKEVLIESYGKIIEQIPFINDNFSTETKEKIVFSLKSLTFSPEDYVYQVSFRNYFLK